MQSAQPYANLSYESHVPQQQPPPYVVTKNHPIDQSYPSYVTQSTAPGAPSQHYVTQTTVTTQKDPTGLRTAIPELPMVLAIILCIVNIILPGIGTIIAGFSVLCCGNVGQSGGGRFGTFCINFWVGFAQILLISFFVGWIWSIMWGFAFIAISAEADKKTATTTTTMTTIPPPVMVGQPLPQSNLPYAEPTLPYPPQSQ